MVMGRVMVIVMVMAMLMVMVRMGSDQIKWMFEVVPQSSTAIETHFGISQIT